MTITDYWLLVKIKCVAYLSELCWWHLGSEWWLAFDFLHLDRSIDNNPIYVCVLAAVRVQGLIWHNPQTNKRCKLNESQECEPGTCEIDLGRTLQNVSFGVWPARCCLYRRRRSRGTCPRILPRGWRADSVSVPQSPNSWPDRPQRPVALNQSVSCGMHTARIPIHSDGEVPLSLCSAAHVPTPSRGMPAFNARQQQGSRPLFVAKSKRSAQT